MEATAVLETAAESVGVRVPLLAPFIMEMMMELKIRLVEITTELEDAYLMEYNEVPYETWTPCLFIEDDRPVPNVLRTMVPNYKDYDYIVVDTR